MIAEKEHNPNEKEYNIIDKANRLLDYAIDQFIEKNNDIALLIHISR